MSQYTPVSLSRMGGGALEERFGLAVKDVLGNIMDPNTDPTSTRKITMEVIIKPTKDRRMGDVRIKVKTTLCPTQAMETTFYMGHQEGELVAVEENPAQVSLAFPTDAPQQPAVETTAAK